MKRQTINGSTATYEHVFSLAYGRKGELWWELMEVCTLCAPFCG